jgi:hypothetical protein
MAHERHFDGFDLDLARDYVEGADIGDAVIVLIRAIREHFAWHVAQDAKEAKGRGAGSR